MVTAEMSQRGAYAGWDFENVWDIGGAGYPWLREIAPEPAPGAAFEPWRAPVNAIVDKPLVRAAGRTIRVNARPGAPVQIRLVDMKGKIAAKYDAVGTARLVVNNVPSGRYIVEARERGGRVGAAPVRILK
jgi:hypothetical protein